MTLPRDSESGHVVATPSLVKECSCLPVKESTANQVSLFLPEQDKHKVFYATCSHLISGATHTYGLYYEQSHYTRIVYTELLKLST